MSTTITKVTDITTIDSGTLAALTPLELKSLTTIQLGALTADQLSGLSATLVSMLPLKYIPAAALKGISTTAIEGLAVKFLSVAQITELSAPQIAKLTTKQMLALQPAQFNALTSVGALSADQLGALKATVFKGLTPDSISHMTTDTAAALTITQLSKLTTVDGGQLEAFTPTQVAHFLTDAITWLHNHNFSTISGTATIGSGIETSKIVESSKIVAISAPLSIAGGNGADSITGSTGTDVITGGLGNDTITGGAGADTITGGAGNDVYKYNAGDSIVGSVDLLIGSFDGYSADLVKLNDIVGTLSLLPSQSISALSEADLNILLNSTNGTGTHFKGGNNTSIAQLTDGTSKYWAIDLNGDGSFTTSADLLINVTGSTGVTVETFGVRLPTLSTISTVTDAIEDTEKEISFANLMALADEADVDGTVTGFVVKSVLTGTLKIGITSSEATAFDASTNATIDATHFAYWTPATNANGTLNAFSVVAKDNSDAVSASAIPVQVAVTPVIAQTFPEGTSSALAYKTDYDGMSGLSALTVEMRVKTIDTKGGLLSWAASGIGNDFLLYLTSSSTFDIWVGNKNYEVTITKNISDSNWHHLAATWTTAGTVTLYVDGTAYAATVASGYTAYATALTNTSAISNDRLLLGNDQDRDSAGAITLDPTQTFSGSIDSVAVWNSAKTFTPTTYKTAITESDTNLVNYWSMDESTGNLVDSKSGMNLTTVRTAGALTTTTETTFLKDFSSSPTDFSKSGSALTVGTKGLGGGAGVTIPSGSDEIWTLNNPCPITANNGTYAVSGYFHNVSNSGFGALGFSTNLSNSSAGSSGAPGSNSFLGVAFHGGGIYFLNNGAITSLNNASGDITLNNWYKFIFSISETNATTFNLKLDTYNSDANGALSGLFGSLSTSVTNTSISTFANLYPFFSAEGSRFDALDNFEITLTGV